MANRFYRLNIEFDLKNQNSNDEYGDHDGRHFHNMDEETLEIAESLEENGSSSSSSSSTSSSGSSFTHGMAHGHHRNNNVTRTFRVYSNPFVQERRKKKRNRDHVIPDASTSTAAITVTPPVVGSNPQTATAAADAWNPCSISEDVVVFKKYGVDPKYADHHHHDGKGCYGCNVQCNSIPIKQSNMKVLLEKISQSGLNTGNMLDRAENIRSNYLDLIVEPKRKLHQLLKESSNHEEEEEGGESDFDPHHNCRNEEKHERPGKKRKLNSGSSARSLTTTDSNAGKIDDSIDEWDTMQIYNHLRRHQMNVIDQVQYRRAKLWDIMEEMDRNCLFVEHESKKNALGERLKRADPDQFKVYLAVQDKWLALSKSRPDLMRPFYDPDKANQQGISNNKEAVGEIINVSGQLLFGKKTKR